MVTFQVQIPESQQTAFLKLLESLKNLGVVSSFVTADATSKTAMPIEQLLAVLADSEQQLNEGRSVSADQVMAFFKSWKQQSA
jgi:hypothetical protein